WRSMKLETVCLRFANVYGPYSGRKSSVVAKWISRIRNGEPVEIYGDGSQTRDFVWAGDIAQAIVFSLESPHASGEIFQIGSGESVSISQLVELLKKASGLDFPVQYAPALPGEIQRVLCDMRHARHLLGLSEMTPIEYGLPRTWDWFARR
ncbi:MAG TPA: NAD-dependent epimerase/dehydratase family protein, partial [bacterium]|nr:NAD-dependent epimerase/dehydratase family protein [bacterium]